MNVSMTEVATTMRTRFESGGAAPEPADILESNGHCQNNTNAPACRGRADSLRSLFQKAAALVLFQHALGCFDRRDDNDRHGADQPGKKQVLKKRQDMVDQEVH